MGTSSPIQDTQHCELIDKYFPLVGIDWIMAIRDDLGLSLPKTTEEERLYTLSQLKGASIPIATQEDNVLCLLAKITADRAQSTFIRVTKGLNILNQSGMPLDFHPAPTPIEPRSRKWLNR